MTTSNDDAQVGYTSLEDEKSGLLGSPSGLLARVGVPPYAERQGSWLVWSWIHPTDSEARLHETEATGVLDAFQRIKDADDVVRFVRQFGSIKICEHQLPATHKPAPWNPSTLPESCSAFENRSGTFREPIGRWLHYARQARGLLQVASALRDNPQDSGPRSAWEDIYEDNPSALNQIRLALEVPELLLSLVVNEWLALGDARPALTGHGRQLEFEMGGGLFALIGVQLALALTQSRDLHTCSGCGTYYLRQERRAQVGRRNYCHDCKRRGRPARDRQRDRRARQRAEAG